MVLPICTSTISKVVYSYHTYCTPIHPPAAPRVGAEGAEGAADVEAGVQVVACQMAVYADRVEAFGRLATGRRGDDSDLAELSSTP